MFSPRRKQIQPMLYFRQLEIKEELRRLFLLDVESICVGLRHSSRPGPCISEQDQADELQVVVCQAIGKLWVVSGIGNDCFGRASDGFDTVLQLPAKLTAFRGIEVWRLLLRRRPMHFRERRRAAGQALPRS